MTFTNHFYVGTTYRELYDRIKEHENKRGSIWTGFKCMALWADVRTEHASRLESGSCTGSASGTCAGATT